MTSGKDRKRALLELARTRGAKGTGSSPSTTEPIAAPPLSVAPAEGPEPERKRRRLVKALPPTVAVAAEPTPSTEEESSGFPLIHRKRKHQEVGGFLLSGLRKLRWYRSRRVHPHLLLLNLPQHQLSLSLLSAYHLRRLNLCLQRHFHLHPQWAKLLVNSLHLLGVTLPIQGVSQDFLHHHHRQPLLLLLKVVRPARSQAALAPVMRISAGSLPWFDTSYAAVSFSSGVGRRWMRTWPSR